IAVLTRRDIPSIAAARPAAPEWGSDVVAEMLRRLDIPYIALEPGASFRGLHDSIVNYLGNERPAMILANHEEVAVAIAHGYAKVTGRAMAGAVRSGARSGRARARRASARRGGAPRDPPRTDRRVAGSRRARGVARRRGRERRRRRGLLSHRSPAPSRRVADAVPRCLRGGGP